MGQPTPQIVYHSGTTKVTVSPSFVYEVSLYLLYKDRAECQGSKFYSSDHAISYKEATYKRLDKETVVARYVTMLSAPLDYLLSSNFKLFNKDEKIGQRRKPSAGSKRGGSKNSRS